ncbi:MAG: hypothetical protein AB2794_14810 [Candidatus Thiodiazotropha endolucinida]
MIEEFKKDLQTLPPSIVASKWITDRTPILFDNRHYEYLVWKETLGEQIGIDGRSIAIIGGACVGFSLNPGKYFKAFEEGSDIDVAIISSHHFNISWHCLRGLGTGIYKLSQAQQNIVRDHVNRLIYWGTIATDKILEILPFGAEWLQATNNMSQLEDTLGRDINFRIYRDFESLKAYQLLGVKKARDSIISTPSIEVIE